MKVSPHGGGNLVPPVNSAEVFRYGVRVTHPQKQQSLTQKPSCDNKLLIQALLYRTVHM